MTRLTHFALRRPVAAWVLLATLTIGFAAGLPQLRTEVGYRAFLGDDHPSVLALDAFLERFAGGLPMIAVWSCVESPCDTALDAESLGMAAAVSEALRSSSAVRRATSPASAPVLIATPAGPLPRYFVEDGTVAADRANLARQALRDPMWRGQLISPDARTGAIAIELTDSESDTSIAAYATLEAALAPFEAKGWRFHRVGGPVEFVVAGGELEAATGRLVPIMVLLIGGMLWLLFRSLAVASAVLVAVGVAVLWAMGLLGWMGGWGWAQNSLTQTLPPLVLAIGVCDAIHLVSRYASRSGDREERLLLASADVAAPCLMTTITTMVGFLSFLGAELQSFARFGVLAAFGVGAALLTTFTLLPLLLRLVNPEGVRAAEASNQWERGLAAMLWLPERHAAAILTTALALGAICAFGMTRLEVDASFEELYGEHSAVVGWVQFAAKHLREPDSLEVELVLPADARLEDPQTLAVIARTADSLSSLETLGRARSLLDPLSFTHRLLRGGDRRFDRPADDSDDNAALLALVSAFGAEVGEDGLAAWTDADRRRVRISVESGKTPQAALRRTMQRVEEILQHELPPGWRGSATGPLAVVHDMIDAIRATQLRSFATAAFAVLVLVALFLRSPGWAAAALMPTVLPVIVTLGAMGLLGIPLDVGSAMVAAVVVGVAVDDTIHLLDAFRRRRRAGAEPALAIRDAVLHVGRALVTTSLALTLGFATLSLSPWKSVASFGVVSAIAIATALLTALLVLPALVAIVAGGRQRSSS